MPMRDFANLHVEIGLLRVLVKAGLALLFAAFLSFLAPFGTYRFSAVERVGYWTFQMGAWLVLSLLAFWLLSLSSRPAPQIRRILAIFLATLPMMVITGIANNMMNGWQPDVGEVVELFVSISLIGGSHAFLSDRLVSGLLETHDIAGEQPEADAGNMSQEVSPRAVPVQAIDTVLLDKLPPHIRDNIISMQGEDHYVRVHSPDSSFMVLMRFSDALRGMEHIDGARVHRSWWVAASAVTVIQKTGRTAQLTLQNGSTVPVSQPYLAHALRTWRSTAMLPN